FDVGIDDVPTVLAQMGGDAVGARGLGKARGTQRIGQLAAARVAHRRHVIDVHSKTHMMGRRHLTTLHFIHLPRHTGEAGRGKATSTISKVSDLKSDSSSLRPSPSG